MLSCETWTNEAIPTTVQDEVYRVFGDSQVVERAYPITSFGNMNDSADTVFMEFFRLDNAAAMAMLAIDDAESSLQIAVAPKKIAKLFAANGIILPAPDQRPSTSNPKYITHQLGKHFGAAVAGGLVPPLSHETLVILRDDPAIAKAFFDNASESLERVFGRVKSLTYHNPDPALDPHWTAAQTAFSKIKQNLEEKWIGLSDFSNPRCG